MAKMIHNDRLHIKLPRTLKKQFYAECRRRGASPSDVVRGLIHNYAERQRTHNVT